MKALGAIGWVVLALLSLALIVGGTYAWRWYTAPLSGKLQAREQINSGDFRIAAYNHFFDLCQSVQTADSNIAVQYQLLDAAPASDKSRIRTNIGGLLSARADGINQYNADAEKSYTIGQFRASQLPWQLPSTPYQAGEQIRCAS